MKQKIRQMKHPCLPSPDRVIDLVAEECDGDIKLRIKMRKDPSDGSPRDRMHRLGIFEKEKIIPEDEFIPEVDRKSCKGKDGDDDERHPSVLEEILHAPYQSFKL